MKSFVAIILIFIISSCCKVSRNELREYINDLDNNVTRHLFAGTNEIFVRYIPWELMWKIQNENSDNKKKKESKNDFSKNVYFEIEINDKGIDPISNSVNNNSRLNEILDQISFGTNQMSFILNQDDKDTIFLQGCVYPRLYGLSKSSKFLVIYEKGNWIESNYFYLVLNIPELNLYERKVRFYYNDIAKIPLLDENE